ncbi:MAG: helix-turn-helix domain-containing protein [Lachnospiraceae bacterium]|nr:helix-turn-helix domain-containing protein [Lachnospiraceae bacterium]
MFDSKSDCKYYDDEDKKRLARMLMLSRFESGLSQEKVSLELGIAKKTVQNWERGISAPTLLQAIEWFRVMKVPAMPYFLQFMFPDLEGTKGKDSEEKLRSELIQMIESIPEEGMRQLMYLFYGDHGSSPRAVMNLVTAHLQSPMKDRYNHAVTILSDYELALEKNQITRSDHIQPDTKLLKKAIQCGHDAILNNKNNYFFIDKE